MRKLRDSIHGNFHPLPSLSLYLSFAMLREVSFWNIAAGKARAELAYQLSARIDILRKM